MKIFSVFIIVVISSALLAWYTAAQKLRSRELVNSFVEDVGDNGDRNDKRDIIRVFELRRGSVISSPLTIKGEARGTWYFEASFPVRLLNSDGKEIAVAPAQAQGEWMTEEFVPFEVVLQFSPPTTSTGTLVLEKDNPSGLPEHANELRVPVRFEVSESAGKRGGCIITGCSGQVCSEEEVMTTCEFRPEYTCFKSARCERLGDGQCGWAPTAQLRQCLDKSGVAADEAVRVY